MLCIFCKITNCKMMNLQRVITASHFLPVVIMLIVVLRSTWCAPATTATPYHDRHRVDSSRARIGSDVCKMRAANVRGKPILFTDLHSERVYSFHCNSTAAKGHCLVLANCSVSPAVFDGERLYPTGESVRVIDERGCSLEPQLFEDVEYTSDTSAAIYNPVPVQLTSSPHVATQLSCSTTLVPSASSCDRWRRARCIRSEYAQNLQWPSARQAGLKAGSGTAKTSVNAGVGTDY